MPRLFTAIEVPTDVSDRIREQHTDIPGAVWESQPHLTLAHFGEIDSEKVDDLFLQLQDLTFSAFELVPNSAGVFEKSGTSVVVWLGLEPSPVLHLLAEKLAEIRARITQQPDAHQFNPHLTLARTGGVDPAEVDAFRAAFNIAAVPAFSVNEFSLMESSNYQYSCIKKFPAS